MTKKKEGLSAKERMAIPRHKMPEQAPQIRIHNFGEVNLGYTAEMAQEEALRCLECKRPLCVEGCPVGVNIPAIIGLVARGKYLEAAVQLQQDNALPAVCGRVCPQENQCERLCVLGKRAEPLAIGNIERFLADYARENNVGGLVTALDQTVDNFLAAYGRENNLDIVQETKTPASGYRVAIIGSGPAGLTAAGDIARMGHDVTVFEALHELGGVLVYGIPEFRLPKAILRTEIAQMEEVGVKFEVDVAVGQTLTVDELMDAEGFDAVFIGTGAGLPRFLRIPGEELNGVYSANEFLTRVNLMKAYKFPESDSPVHVGQRVAVVGGGNVAMDAARTARRLGANVSLVYRRGREEMPARMEEIHHGEEEGLDMLYLTNPVRFEGDEQGWLRRMICERMELGEPDASGRRQPIRIENSEFVLEVDTAVVALGSDTNRMLTSREPDIQTSQRGHIVADRDTGQTSRPGVFAGGDVVTGSATVIEAMGAGRRAARAIDAYLQSMKTSH